MTEELMTAKQIAGMFKLDISSVYRWVREGKLPAPIKSGRRFTRWRAEDIRAVMDKLDTQKKETA